MNMSSSPDLNAGSGLTASPAADPALGVCFGFVVIGRNEGERLARCLRSLRNASSRIVYADSVSTDGSAELASALGATVVSVEPVGPLNAARGRNAGLAAFRQHFPECKYVQFLDGDCVLLSGWVETAISFLQRHERAAITCGRRFEAHPDASFYNRLADEEWNTPVGRAEACGGDAMMRVAALEEVGGFNPSLMASEEPELAARLRVRGWEIWRLDAPMTQHDAAMTQFSQWWRRTVRSGYGYAQAWRSTQHLARPINVDKLRSAAFWALIVPGSALLLAAAARQPTLLLLLPLAYGAQVARVAARLGARSALSWRRAAMLVIGKFAELIGAGRFLLLSRRTHVFEYKASGGG